MSLFSDAFEKIKENEFELLLKDFIKNEDYKDDPWCSEKYFDYTQCITRMKEELLALRQSVSKEEDNQKVQSYVDTYPDKDFENNEIKSVFKDKLTKPINLSCRYTSDVWADGTPVTKMFHRNEEITLSLKENDYIEGIIFKKDGKTPAEGVVLYVYHTNEKGVYAPAPGQTGMVARHGKLRGWVKTGKDGRYQFTTIRPATYPNTTFAAHIHPMIKEQGLQAYYIDEYVFEDDPYVKADYDRAQELRGGLGVIKLQKDAAVVWKGKRDIILGMNIPGY